MNIDLVLMLGSLILLVISGLLVFCFTESKGKNTPHARKHYKNTSRKSAHSISKQIGLDNKLV